jgi:cysteine desulfurase/selenocysteine lyase
MALTEPTLPAVDPLDVAAIKADFPLLTDTTVNGYPIVYLDSASSSQKPQAVLDVMDDVYGHTYANVHRGVYGIAAEATDRYEAARAKVARFIKAPSTAGVVFTKNVTEAFNLVAYTWGKGCFPRYGKDKATLLSGAHLAYHPSMPEDEILS